MTVGTPFLTQQMHPTVVIGAYRQAQEDLIESLRDQVSVQIDINDRAEMMKIVKSSLGTKFIKKW